MDLLLDEELVIKLHNQRRIGKQFRGKLKNNLDFAEWMCDLV